MRVRVIEVNCVKLLVYRGIWGLPLKLMKVIMKTNAKCDLMVGIAVNRYLRKVSKLRSKNV